MSEEQLLDRQAVCPPRSRQQVEPRPHLTHSHWPLHTFSEFESSSVPGPVLGPP